MEKRGTASLATGRMMELGAAVLRQLPRNLNPDIALNLIENQGPLKWMLHEALDSSTKSSFATIEVFPVRIDYNQSLEKMIMVGRYEEVGRLVRGKCLPVPSVQWRRGGVVDINIKLVHFTKYIEYPDMAISELAKLDLRPADLIELLAFGATYLEEQRKSPIPALGSACSCKEPIAPYLWVKEGKRILDTRMLEMWFWEEDDCRFAAVRK